MNITNMFYNILEQKKIMLQIVTTISSADGGSSNGQPTKPYSGQHIHGTIWERSPITSGT